ncbi:MAG: sugar-binding domain-containing protein [Verrucomicrobiota bacterium]
MFVTLTLRLRLALPLLLGLAAPAAFAAGGAAALPAPVTLTSGWLMQDVAQVTAGGAVISRVGFAPDIYRPVPYAPPPTADANPPTATVIQPELRNFPRTAQLRRGDTSPAGLAEGWPLNPEPNRPSFSSGWTQAPGPSAKAWYRAIVPGTVLATLVDNHLYPDPLYGENNRPNIIPESLARTSYWYRTELTVPAGFTGRRVWLNFEGINYAAEVWVNGVKAGDITGAFIRGNFDITDHVRPGEKAAIAVLIHPPPHPGDPWEKTVANQRGPNGAGVNGPLGQDGPTFVAAIGWDWVPGIRDRQSGIWQNVSLSASGPVLVQNPFVTTDLPLPRTDSADVSIEVTLKNVSASPQTGVLTGRLGDITFQSAPVTLPSQGSQVVKLAPDTTPALRVANPRLWWPNGFGEPNLYPLRLAFDIAGATSDTKELNVGIRQVTYFVPGSTNLTLSVNGVPVYAKGGNWGMDDAMKRLPRERLEAIVRLHRDANYTIIRNWVGQSTTEDLFDFCDRYGIMLWDEFFQANPNNGLNPLDSGLYLSNVRDTVLRFRNHPSIVIWCGRNEGDPQAVIDQGNAAILRELDPARYYQSSSTSRNGVSSGGPYSYQLPRAYYSGATSGLNVAFKTEIGSASIPTLEAVQAMMPEKDWFGPNFPNDAWAEHDLVTGNGNPVNAALQTVLPRRFGAFDSLAGFVRLAQLADYETFRAMYESRFSRLFAPSTAVITWMSHPAQPCLVWQIYDYSLEPFASYFAVKKACEPVHIMMTQDTFEATLVNHTPAALGGLKWRLRVVDLDGTVRLDRTSPVASAPASAATSLGVILFPSDLSPVHFVKLELLDAAGRVVSDNFYWRETVPDDFTALNTIPDVMLELKISRHDAGGRVLLDVTLSNPTKNVAVMAHLQLRNQRTNARVLPVTYNDNYVSLLPGESRVITIEAAAKDLGADPPLVVLDGWNVTTKAQAFTAGGRSSIAPNTPALVTRPVAGPVASAAK